MVQPPKVKSISYILTQAEIQGLLGRFLTGLKEAGFLIPKNIPAKWVVDCTKAGNGLSALKYLSRHLYRGVISEDNIVSANHGFITFKYIDSSTGDTKYRKLKGDDFFTIDRTACVTQRLQTSQRLRIPSWQCQKASLSDTVDIKGDNSTSRTKTTSSFQMFLLCIRTKASADIALSIEKNYSAVYSSY